MCTSARSILDLSEMEHLPVLATQPLSVPQLSFARHTEPRDPGPKAVHCICGTALPVHSCAIASQYIEQFRNFLSIFEVSGPTLLRDCPSLVYGRRHSPTCYNPACLLHSAMQSPSKRTTVGPLIIVALRYLQRQLDTQKIHLQHLTIMSNCYNTRRSYYRTGLHCFTATCGNEERGGAHVKGCLWPISCSTLWMNRYVAAPVCVPPDSAAVSWASWLSLHAPNCTASPPRVPLYTLHALHGHSNTHSTSQNTRSSAIETCTRSRQSRSLAWACLALHTPLDTTNSKHQSYHRVRGHGEIQMPEQQRRKVATAACERPKAGLRTSGSRTDRESTNIQSYFHKGATCPHAEVR